MDAMVAFLTVLALCIFFVGKLKINSAVAPLLSLSIIMVYFSLAGVLNVLLAAGWFFYLLVLGLLLFTVFTTKPKQWIGRLFSPGFCLFLTASTFLLVLFALRKPVFSNWDEFSLWGTAAKLLKLNNQLYSTADIGWPWTATQSPGLFVLGYFAQFFGKGFVPWKVYWAYDVLYFACFAPLLGSLSRKQWRIAVPVGVTALLLPFFFTVYHKQVYLNTAYLTSYGDLAAGIVFGGVLACYFLLRSQPAQKMWPALLSLTAFALVKDNAFPIVLVAMVIMLADTLLFARPKQLQQSTKAKNWWGFIAGSFAAAILPYMVWGRYAAWANAQNTFTSGEATGVDPISAAIQALPQLLGIRPKTQRFADTLPKFLYAFLGKSAENPQDTTLVFPVSMAGSAFGTAVLVLIVFVLAVLFAKNSTGRRRILLAAALTSAGFLGYLYVLLVSFGFVFKTESIVDFGRYLSSYLPGWLMLGGFFLTQTALPVQETNKEKSHRQHRALPTLCLTGAACVLVGIFLKLAPASLTVLGYPDIVYNKQHQQQQIADAIAKQVPPGQRVFFVCQNGDGSQWFSLSYYLLPVVVDYSLTGGSGFMPQGSMNENEKDGYIPLQQLQQYLQTENCGAVWIQHTDEVFTSAYGSLFTDNLATAKNTPTLYLIEPNGLYAPVAPAELEG